MPGKFKAITDWFSGVRSPSKADGANALSEEQKKENHEINGLPLENVAQTDAEGSEGQPQHGTKKTTTQRQDKASHVTQEQHDNMEDKTDAEPEAQGSQGESECPVHGMGKKGRAKKRANVADKPEATGTSNTINAQTPSHHRKIGKKKRGLCQCPDTHKKAEKPSSTLTNEAPQGTDTAQPPAEEPKSISSNEMSEGNRNLQAKHKDKEAPASCQHTEAEGSKQENNDRDFPMSSSGNEAHPPVPIETRCCKSGDVLFIDPDRGKPADPQPPPKCALCGQPWPADLPYPKSKNKTKSKYGDVMCKKCADGEALEQGEERKKVMVSMDMQTDARELSLEKEKVMVSMGVQTDDRELSPEKKKVMVSKEVQTDDRELSPDHHCEPISLFRESGVPEQENVPDEADKPKGRKKALLIGINYSGQKHELKGCRPDVINMYNYLVKKGFHDENIAILMDIWDYQPPTRNNIINHMKILVKDAEPGDSLFFHYSGHGGQTKDKQGDELDGEDEGIYPVDYNFSKPKGILVDDIMHNILVYIPEGVHLTAVFDSCHSGSVLDLPYVLTADGKVNKADPRKQREPYKDVGRVILWSGCKDSQTSADTNIKGKAVGAMSYTFIEATKLLEEQKQGNMHVGRKADYTYDELLIKIREILHEKYSQVPQLSSNIPLDPETHKFFI